MFKVIVHTNGKVVLWWWTAHPNALGEGAWCKSHHLHFSSYPDNNRCKNQTILWMISWVDVLLLLSGSEWIVIVCPVSDIGSVFRHITLSQTDVLFAVVQTEKNIVKLIEEIKKSFSRDNAVSSHCCCRHRHDDSIRQGLCVWGRKVPWGNDELHFSLCNDGISV